jgi:hypothetical protein
MRAENADGLAGLHEQRFVVLERLQRPDDRVKRRPAAGGAAGAAVDNQIVRPLGDLGIQVVHQHAQRGFLRPSLARQRRASRCSDGSRGQRHE